MNSLQSRIRGISNLLFFVYSPDTVRMEKADSSLCLDAGDFLI